MQSTKVSVIVLILTGDYENMKITGNEITNDNITPYTAALKKEDERRKLLLDQKKECMTQRAFQNYQSSLKNFDSTYNLANIVILEQNRMLNHRVNFLNRIYNVKAFI